MPTRRLRRAKDREDLFQWLGGQDNSQAPFKSLKDVFVVAACLGHSYGQSSKLLPGGEQFGPDVFSMQDEALFNAIAIAHFGQVEVLHPDREEERLNVIEQYANEGVVLLQEIARKGLDPLEEVLASFAQEEGDRVPGCCCPGCLSPRFLRGNALGKGWSVATPSGNADRSMHGERRVSALWHLGAQNAWTATGSAGFGDPRGLWRL